MAQKFNFENQQNHSAPELPTRKSKADRAVEAERDQMLAAAKKTEQAPKQLELFDLGEFRSEEAKKPEKGFFGNMKDRMVGAAKKTWENLKSLKKPSENKNSSENNEPTENVEGTETPVQLELDLGMSEAREEITGGMTPVERKNLFKQMKGWSKDQIEKYKSLPTKDKIIVAGIAVGAIGLVGAGGFAAVTAAGFSGSGIGSFTALGMGKSVLGFGAIEGVKGVAVGTAATMAKVYAGGMAAGAITGSGLSAYGGFKVLDKLSKKAKGNNINPEDLETVTTTASLENNSQTPNQASQNETIPDISTAEPEPINQRKGFGRVIDRAKNSFQPTQQTRQNMPLQAVEDLVKVEKVQQDVAEPQNQPQENLKSQKDIGEIANEVTDRMYGMDPTVPLEEFVNNICKLKIEKEISELVNPDEDEKANEVRVIKRVYQSVRSEIFNDPKFQQKSKEHADKLNAQKKVEPQVNVEPVEPIQELTQPEMVISTEMRNSLDTLKASVPTIEAIPEHVNTQEQRTRRHLNLREKLTHLSGKQRPERKKHHQKALETLRQNSEFKEKPKYEGIDVKAEAELLLNEYLKTDEWGLTRLSYGGSDINNICSEKINSYGIKYSSENSEILKNIEEDYYQVSKEIAEIVKERIQERKTNEVLTFTQPENLENAEISKGSEPKKPEDRLAQLKSENQSIAVEPEVITEAKNEPSEVPEILVNEPSPQVESTQIAENNDSPELASLNMELARLNSEFSATDEAWSNVGSLDRQEQVVLGRNRRNIGDKMMEIKGIIEKTKELQRKQKLTEAPINNSSENLNALEMVKELERMEEELEDLSTGTPEEAELSIKIKEMNTRIYETGVEGLMSNKVIGKVRAKVFAKLKNNILNSDYTDLEKFVNNPLEFNTESNKEFVINHLTSGIEEAKKTIIEYTKHSESTKAQIGDSNSDDGYIGMMKDELSRYNTTVSNSQNVVTNYSKALEIINSL